jgi:hypothetical protein
MLMLKRCSSPVAILLAAVAAAALVAMPSSAVQAAANSEQVVFSGIGLPPTSSEAFGFWVWCQNEEAAPSRGRYETDCNGALYFYQRGIVVHVTGEISELEEGVYQMDLESRDGRVVCTLTNVPPILHGPHNTVTADPCTVDGVAVAGLTSTNAVVNATGP